MQRMERQDGWLAAFFTVLLPWVLVLAIAGGIGTLVVSHTIASRSPAAPLPTATFSADPAGAAAEAEKVLDGNDVPACRTVGGQRSVWVPSLKVKASWRESGFIDGWMQIPRDVAKVAAWQSGAAGSGKGTFLLAGHVDAYDQGHGAFYPLSGVKRGAIIYLTDSRCRVTAWTVTGLSTSTKDDLPDWLFAATGPERLALVTCGGPVERGPNGVHYRDNVIVEAVPVN